MLIITDKIESVVREVSVDYFEGIGLIIANAILRLLALLFILLSIIMYLFW